MNATSPSESVTVGVPVYRGELFIEETLRSIQNQTHRAIEVVISLDGPQPEAEALCRPFLSDPRFRLVTQPERLGWVAHLNWLMARVETPFWCYQQQDDVVDPCYLEVLVEHARRMPGGAVFYSDMQAFGDLEISFVQASVTGSAFARQLVLLHEHFPAVAFRGLSRVEALRSSGGIPPNAVDSFACDTAWMAAMARWGELQRVPGALYHKRYHAANEHMRWFGWPLEKKHRAWMLHCAAMLEQAMLAQATAHERRVLWLGAIGRLGWSHIANSYLPIATWSDAERAALLAAFLEHVRTASNLDIPQLLCSSWDEIDEWTSAFCRLPANG